MTTTDTITTTGHAVAAGEGERVWIVGDTMTFKATADQTGGSMAAVEALAAPGGGPPLHIHRDEDEMWYVIDGEFEILAGEETLRLGAGGFAFVPRGTLHRFENVSDTPSRVLIVFTPGGFDGFFFEAGVPAVDGEAAPPVGADEIQRTRAAAPRYGLELRWPQEVSV